LAITVNGYSQISFRNYKPTSDLSLVSIINNKNIKPGLVLYNPTLKLNVVYSGSDYQYYFTSPDIRNLNRRGAFIDSTNPYGTTKPLVGLGSSLIKILFDKTIN
jgi:hypothetical protein